jgi:hypothetical protein
LSLCRSQGTGRPFERPFPTNCISKALQNGRQSDSRSGVGEETRDAPDPPRQRKRSSSSMEVRPFLNREYHSNVLDLLNGVSPNAYCSILYVSVAVLPSFWQNLMQTRCSFNTSISQYDGGTNTIAL